MKITRQAIALLIAALLACLLAGCFAGPSRSSHQEADSSDDCAQVLDIVMKYARSGESSDRANDGMALLSENCPTEFAIAADYSSGAVKVLGVQSCDKLAETLRFEAVKMLYEDGYCDDTPAPVAWPNDGIGWDSARDYAGTYQRICGPVTSLRNTYDGAFVNVGLDYPDAGRFTFIMWGFQLEPIAGGTTACAAGNIYLYDGVAQMELGSPAELETWK